MAKKSESTTTLQVVGAVDGIQLVNQKLAQLKHIEESKYKTNGTLAGFNNLHTETNLVNLIKAYSSVRGRAKGYDEAQVELGVSSAPVFKAEGGTLEEYKHDIQLRIAIIQNEETITKLKEFKKGFEELMGKEERMELLTKQFAEFVGL